ncbi:MAG: GatB/YqeY domain-containing protein [Acidobacteria bacterium]|nr:GatB/YqeY domain-containing protein [Acidobacteriota bacterium]
MSLTEQIQNDLTEAMRRREELRLSTLRMMKSALQYKKIEKRAPLDDKEALAVLSHLIKQRKDSVEQFTKGGRTDLADKEAAEIRIIEAYMPKAAGEEDIAAVVRAAMDDFGSPTIKDMGIIMKSVLAKFAASSTRVDGKLVSDIVKRMLSGPSA